jgi:tetratricopeptide (TPR) repeat protein
MISRATMFLIAAIAFAASAMLPLCNSASAQSTAATGERCQVQWVCKKVPVRDRKCDHGRAIADATKAIALNPKNALPYNNRADAYLELDQASQGLPDAEKAVQLAPGAARILETRGEIYATLGRRDEAVENLKTALEIDPHLKCPQERF